MGSSAHTHSACCTLCPVARAQRIISETIKFILVWGCVCLPGLYLRGACVLPTAPLQQHKRMSKTIDQRLNVFWSGSRRRGVCLCYDWINRASPVVVLLFLFYFILTIFQGETIKRWDSYEPVSPFPSPANGFDHSKLTCYSGYARYHYCRSSSWWIQLH